MIQNRGRSPHVSSPPPPPPPSNVMSSSIQRPLPLRRKSTTPAMAHDEDAGLTQSLSRLSITNEPHQPTSSRSRRASTASNISLRPPPQSPLSAAPRPRDPSRSPSHGSHPRRETRAGTPTLLRKASANSLHSVGGSTSRRSSSSRRPSHSLAMPPSSSSTPFEEEKPPVTANSIANDYFRTELEAHHGSVATLPTDTIVILNDAVYGHRFSRPRTSRSALSTIVERPERIKASVLGISTAYVRLGGRHCQGRVPIHPKRNILQVDSIPFRIHKTTRRLPLTSPAVTNVHGVKWMQELKFMCDSAESTLAMGGKELQRRDVPRGLDDPVPQRLHEGDLYLCAESLNAVEGALGAVCEAVDTVFGDGPRRAFVGVRPPGHHCSASHPSGFCWVNNVHVGIMHAALNHGLTHAAIMDFDLHHGDGSQAIAWEHNARAAASKKNEAHWKKTSIGYFSLHDINSYPCEWGDLDKVRNASICIDNAHGQAIWNVHLQPWKTEHDFWKLYESTYSILLDKTRNYLREQARKLGEANQTPKAAIFFSAGFDASEWEGADMQRHRVNVPTEFYARLTQDVVKLAAEEGLAVDGRAISVLEGGYSDRALCSGILSHLSGMVGDVEDAEPPVETEQEPSGLGYEMGKRIGGLNMGTDPASEQKDPPPPARAYDPLWWASDQLDQLEQDARPPPKPRNATPPTYSSPTQASSARVADPVNMRRSLSSLSTGQQARVAQRPPSPPPPEVSWVVAARELCNVLIPTDRQTDSHKAEELNAEASRARRDRQSTLLGHPPPSSTPTGGDRPSSRMSLRERRPRAIGPIDEETSETLPRTRRKQATTTPVASPMKATRGPCQANLTQSARRPSRGLGGASTTLSAPSEEAAPPTPPIPATAPAPRRTTTSRPTSRTGRVQSSDKVPLQKPRQSAASGEARGSRAMKKASTPARAGKQAVLVGADTPTPSTGVADGVTGRGSTTADVKHITAGVKKIRINLITQSRKEKMAGYKTPEDGTSESAVERGIVVDGDAVLVKTESTTPVEDVSSESPVGHGIRFDGDDAIIAGTESTPPVGDMLLPSESPVRDGIYDGDSIVVGAESTPPVGGDTSSMMLEEGSEEPPAQAPAPPSIPSLSGGHGIVVSHPGGEASPCPSSTSSPTSCAPTVVVGRGIPSSPDVVHVPTPAARGPSDDLAVVGLPQPQPPQWPPPNVSMPAGGTPSDPAGRVVPKGGSGLFSYQSDVGIPFAPRPDGAGWSGGGPVVGGENENEPGLEVKARMHPSSPWSGSGPGSAGGKR